MKNGVKEKKPKKHKLIATTPDWLDLPEPIATNIILEHLDVVDYVRFSAICKKWQSIHKEHRIRYSPSPPPSPLPFPWLRCSHCLHSDEYMAFHFYLPDKQKSYSIPPYETPKRINGAGYVYGWILLLVKYDPYCQSVFIMNPITGVQILLPLFKSRFFCVFISSSPSDPDCTVVLLDDDHYIYFYRLNDDNSLIKTDYSIINGCWPFFFRNKVYYMMHCKQIRIVDFLLPHPIGKMIEMDCSEISVDFHKKMFFLVDFLGELVMVIAEGFVETDYDSIKEFHIYRADFSTNKWVRMESLGDHVLFFSYDSIFSLPAVSVGFKKNAVYLAGGLKGRGVAWKAFDISTKNWIDGPRMSLPSNKCRCYGKWSWFLPTLDYYNVSNTNGACQIQLK